MGRLTGLLKRYGKQWQGQITAVTDSVASSIVNGASVVPLHRLHGYTDFWAAAQPPKNPGYDGKCYL